MLILAIDPGPEESAYVLLNGKSIEVALKVDNERLLGTLIFAKADVVGVEMIESYGMPVGREVFETVHWGGRFCERALVNCTLSVLRVPRRHVKLHLCHDSRAKDSNIRQAIIDRYGGKQQTRKGGSLAKVHGDCWQALALALFVSDTEGGNDAKLVRTTR
jgi:hypothetical protein